MSAATDQQAFDVCGELPHGVTVLEASAGTGKTFTIAGLTARYVAEGVPLEQLLVMTFTRNATAELRDRVRERLVSAERGLAKKLRGEPIDETDDILKLLASENVEQRQRNIARAVADFDAATIVTTHGFCQEVLGGLGNAGDLEPGVEFVEDDSDLVEQVVDDLYIRAFHHAQLVPINRKQADSIARLAVRNPDADIEPRPDTTTAPGRRAGLAHAVRTELKRRKRQLQVMSYDDLLTRLLEALQQDAKGEIVDRLRKRFSVVLVDEFQDTDRMQWDIVERAFGPGTGTTLVLIGDPKQAIYAFRGADVFAYLDAARNAERQETLDINWRSDQRLIDAYDALFGNAQLGHEGIVYRTVRAADANRQPRLTNTDQKPLRIRVVDRNDVGVSRGRALIDPARAHVANDLADDVVRLLESEATIEQHKVAPGDIAVLVRRNKDAELVSDALASANVPAVLAGAGSVFETPAAREWLWLLQALERPSSEARAHAAALTSFFGRTASQVANATEDEWEDVHGTLHRWAHILRDKGVAALTERAMLTQQIPERVLTTSDGERMLTDLRHTSELLHQAAMEQSLGTSALTSWLRTRINDAQKELGNEDRSRRLESDAAAVQILTIHRSKGLEFPIVYLPYLWDPSPVSSARDPLAFHDEHGQRKIDVGLEGADYRRHRDKSVEEQRGEDLRLMYVALTRARHQAVVWWCATNRTAHSPLGRLVFAKQDDGTVPAEGRGSPPDAQATDRFAQLGDEIAVEPAKLGTPKSWSPPLEAPTQLEAARFDRTLDTEWRRTSYSDLTAHTTHDAHVASEPEEDVNDDETPDDGTASAAAEATLEHEHLHAIELPLKDMPGGVRIGTLVHDVLEATDFAAPDLEAELRKQITKARARRATDVGSQDALVEGLKQMIETPLGIGLSLRDLQRKDRLDELVFELPLAGGDKPHGEVTPHAIAQVLTEHLRPSDPLATYAQRLADPELRHAVRGYLTGSIDLLLRHDGRFAIVDYKTNRLASADEPLTAWHYRQEALAEEMQRSHYVLQALLYTVATHRYLRWRLTDYDPEAHLAGVLYLFVRGMTGDAHTGVFAWRPPDALVVALSDLFDRGAPKT